MQLSPRRLLRIVLSLVIIAVLWYRTAGQWRERGGLWVTGAVVLSILLLLVVIVEVTGMQQKWRKQRDDVPKKPLGL
ncbi:MAG TPA: hypothetical protein VKX49_13600 [Bryobacteraceae bacterium]|nr:hypothetical protein [Bryobacteraceae bacterium]